MPERDLERAACGTPLIDPPHPRASGRLLPFFDQRATGDELCALLDAKLDAAQRRHAEALIAPPIPIAGPAPGTGRKPIHSTYAEHSHSRAWRKRQKRAARRCWLWAQQCRDRGGRPLDRNAVARLLHAARAWNRSARLAGEHGGPLARTGVEVLAALVRIASRHGGRCWPSYGVIAAEAGVARSTAQLAVSRLEAAGFISVVGRRDRGRRRDGRFLPITISNSYVFASPCAHAQHRHRPGTENRAGIPDISKKALGIRLPAARNADIESDLARCEAQWAG